MLWFSVQTKGLNRQFFLVLLIDVDCILDYCVSENEYRDVLSLSALAYAALCFKSMLHMKSFSYLSGLCNSFGNVKDGVGWYVQRNAKTMRWTCKLMHTRWTFFEMVKESESYFLCHFSQSHFAMRRWFLYYGFYVGFTLKMVFDSQSLQ